MKSYIKYKHSDWKLAITSIKMTMFEAKNYSVTNES